MKYLPLIGIGLGIWGLITADWIKAGIGALLFFGGFFVDLKKKDGALNDDEVFNSYRVLSELIRMIRATIEDSKANQDKSKLAQGLFFLGMIDAASQSASLDDSQFISLFKAVFADIDFEFDSEYQAKMMMFHQSMATSHPAFPAIMKGGEVFAKFSQGVATAPLAGGMFITELAEAPDFPDSIYAL